MSPLQDITGVPSGAGDAQEQPEHEYEIPDDPHLPALIQRYRGDLARAILEEPDVNLHDQRTGVWTKDLLLSPERMSRLDNMLGEKKIIVFIDISHLSVPNKFGLGTDIDLYMEKLGALMRRTVGNHGAVVRVGGDEFCFVLRRSQAASLSLASFREQADALRQTMLADMRERQPDALDRAEEYARKRQLWRSLIGAFKRDHPDGAVTGFIAFLQKRYPHLSFRMEGDESVDTIVAALDTLAAGGADLTEDARLCALDDTTIQVDVPMTPRLLARAMTGCDDAIHLQKETKKAHRAVLADAPSEDQLDEISRAEKSEADLHAWRETLTHPALTETEREDTLLNIRLEQAIDPSSHAVLRDRIPVKVEADRPYYIHRVEIAQFGAINNVLRYSAGDAVLKILYHTMEEILGEAFLAKIIRGRGGSLLLITDQDIPQEERNRAMQSAQARIVSTLGKRLDTDASKTQALTLEMALRRALSDRSTEEWAGMVLWNTQEVTLHEADQNDDRDQFLLVDLLSKYSVQSS